MMRYSLETADNGCASRYCRREGDLFRKCWMPRIACLQMHSVTLFSISLLAFPPHRAPCTLKLATTRTSMLINPHSRQVHVEHLKYPALYTAPSTTPTTLPANSASTPPMTIYTSGISQAQPTVSAIGFSPYNCRFFCVKARPAGDLRYLRLCVAEVNCMRTAQMATSKCALPVVMSVQVSVNSQMSRRE
jgi:hypothetical protein